MKAIFLFGLLLAFATSQDLVCNNYVTKELDNNCLAVLNEIHETQAWDCNIGEQCVYSSQDKTGSCQIKKFYPGEYCSQTEQCLYGTCVNFTCVAQGFQESCTENKECNPGLYCHSTTSQCETQLAEDASQCTGTWDCQNDLVCNGKKCVPFFSGASTGTTGDCTVFSWNTGDDYFFSDITGFSFACDSMYCVEGKCAAAPISNEQAKQCTQDSNCESGKCNCVVASNGNTLSGRCQEQAGDDLAKNWYQVMEKFVLPHLKNTNDKCNTEGRFRYECWSYTQTDLQDIKSVSAAFAYDWFAMVNGGYNVKNNEDIVIKSINVEFDIYNSYHLLTDVNCWAYECVEIQGDRCLTFNFDTRTYQVESTDCPVNDEFCPPVEMGDTHDTVCVKETYGNGKQGAGNFCRIGTDCYSGICLDNWRCYGNAEGSECNGDTDKTCDVGLACINQNCTSQILADADTNCTNDYQCVNTAVCRGGTCITMFSVANGTSLPGVKCDESIKKDIVCETYTCDSDGNGDLICVEEFVSEYTENYKETDTEYDCKASKRGNVYFANLNCDYRDGKSYCAPHTGDTITQNYIEGFKLLMDYSDQGVCQSFERYDVSCWQYNHNSEDQLTALSLYYEALYEYSVYPALDATVGAQNCVQDLYFSDWKEAETGYKAIAYPAENTDIPRQCSPDPLGGICKIVKNTTEEQEQYWYYETCGDGEYCEYVDYQLYNCTAVEVYNYTVAYIYPGMNCTEDWQCKGDSNTCSNLQCTGLDLGEECVDADDETCDVGLACIEFDSKYICERQLPAGNRTCVNDYQCVNSAACRDGECIEYFSLATGEQIGGQYCDYRYQYKDSVCASYTCDTSNNNKAQCIDAFEYDSRPCAQNDDCKYWTILEDLDVEDIELQGECYSSYNTTKYCQAATGSKLALDYIAAFKKVYKKDQDKCHSYARRNEKCWEFVFHSSTEVENIYAFKAAEEEYANFPNIQTGDNCTNELDYYNWWDAKFNEHLPHEYTLDCPSFTCASEEDEDNFDEEQCVVYDEANYTFWIKQCEDENKLCDTTNEQANFTCVEPKDTFTAGTRKVGQECAKTEDCVGAAECKSNKCKGKSKNSDCTGSGALDCDVGYACIKDTENNYKCLAQLELNSTCEDTLQCVNYGDCRDGKCTGYLSLELGQSSGYSCGSSRQDLLCSTLTCGPTGPTTSECVAAFKTYTSNQQYNKCGENQDCQVYNSQGVMWEGECRCSMSETQSYCSAGSGDQVAIDYAYWFEQIYKLDQGKCHSSMRRESECWSDTIKDEDTRGMFKNYSLAYYEYKDYPVVQLCDDCAKYAYFHDWYLVNNTDTSLNGFLLTLSSLLMVFLFI